MRPSIIKYLNDLFGVTFFNVVIPTPSQIYIIAFVVTSLIFIKRLTSHNEQLRSNIIFSILCGLSAMVGSKLGFILLHLKNYLYMPSHIFASGSISWGAYLGMVFFIFGYTYFKRKSTFHYLDIFATCIPIGIFIGRWSCFLNGDDFGTLSSLPWAVQYPFNSIPFGEHYENGIIDHRAVLSAAVHPNQLYLSLNGLILFFIMKRLWIKYKVIPGSTFAFYLILYGLSRFLLEFYRYCPEEDFFIYLNPSQWFSLLSTSIGLLILRLFHYKLIRNLYNT